MMHDYGYFEEEHLPQGGDLRLWLPSERHRDLSEASLLRYLSSGEIRRVSLQASALAPGTAA